VLHSVRNTLSPIVGSLASVRQKLNDAPTEKIETALSELKQEDTPAERRESLSRYVSLGAGVLTGLTREMGKELETVARGVTHIEEILSEQDRFSHSARAVEPVRIGEVVSEAAGLMPAELRDAAALDFDPGLSDLPPVLAERVVLKQVFANLLNNAAEAILAAEGRPGEIAVTGELETGAGWRRLRIEVRDNGIGIDKEALNHVFEEGVTTRGKKASGIGLHWCANVLHAMSATIEVKSEGPGGGTTVVLRFPMKDQTP